MVTAQVPGTNGSAKSSGKAVSLRRSLVQLALAGMIPLAIAAGAGLLGLLRDQQRETELTSLDVTRVSAAAINVEIERTFALLTLLADSPLLDGDDLAQFEAVVRRAAKAVPAWELVHLARPDGRVLFSTGTPPGEVPPPLVETASLEDVVRSRRPVVGKMSLGPVRGWGVPLRVPVLRAKRLRYVLTAVLDPDAVHGVIENQRLPDGWVISVFDRDGKRIARSPLHQESMGQPPSPSLAELIARGAPEGHGPTLTIEGRSVFSAYTKLPGSDWTVAIGIPTSVIAANAWRAGGWYGAGLLLSLMLALAAAYLAARRIIRPVHELWEAAHELGRGGVPRVPATDVKEVHEVGLALADAGDRRRRGEAALESTVRQLEHARGHLAQQVIDLERLHRLNEEMSRLPALDAQLQAALRALCEFHGTSMGLLSLCDAGAGTLRVAASLGFSPDALKLVETVRCGEGACGLALRDGRRIAIEDTQTDERFEQFAPVARAVGFRAVHSTPLRNRRGLIVGVLSVHLPEPRGPTERERRLADLCAGLAVVFIERAQSQDAADQSQQRLRVALDSTNVPFNILAPVRNAQGTIVDFRWDFVNEAAAQLLHRPARELVGRNMRDFFPAAWNEPGLLEAYAQVAEGGAPIDREIHSLESEVRGWIRVLASRLEGGVAVWFEDVTQRKLQAQAMQDADRRKDEFLATLSHELRNPLSPLISGIELLQRSAAPDMPMIVAMMDRQARHLVRLVDDLLEISRISHGTIELERQPVRLQMIVDAACEICRPLIDDNGHHLQCELCEPDLAVLGDATRLTQIVANLLNNAARYTPPGGIIAVIARRRDDVAEISVRDSGKGMAAGTLANVFQLFMREADSRQSNHQGLGVGLWLVRRLAELHGGTVSAYSAGPGAGSEFTVRLPLAVIARESGTKGQLGAAGHLAGLKIIVVDDNRDAAQSLSALLQACGCETMAVFDGQHALQALAARPGDVMLIDLGMPGMDGFEVARRVRQRAAGRALVLIAVSGWAQPQDREASVAAGFDRHLVKPVGLDALQQAIGDALRARKGSAPTTAAPGATP